MQLLIYATSVFLFVSALFHGLGIVIEPFYYNGLVSPYHDSLIAITLGALAIVFWQSANNLTNQPMIKTLSVISAFGGIGSLLSAYLVDFAQYDASPGKQYVVIAEGLYFTILSVALWRQASSRSK